MITKTFSAATQYSAPVYVDHGRTMSFSISGTFSATIQLQKLMKDETDRDYPLHSDSGWLAVNSYTVATEEQVADGDGNWYRLYCSAYSSGSPVCKMKA